MNADTVKRIIGLSRKRASFAAMRKRGELSEAEAQLVIDQCDAEIAEIRAQSELSLVGGGAVRVAPKSASK